MAVDEQYAQALRDLIRWQAVADQQAAALRRAKTWIEGQMEEKGWPRERIESPPEGSHLDAINKALAAYDTRGVPGLQGKTE